LWFRRRRSEFKKQPDFPAAIDIFPLLSRKISAGFSFPDFPLDTLQPSFYCLAPKQSCDVRTIDLNDFQVATSETARDINRRIVLNLIRKHQPVSRADLSRRSGLQRSTVSVIIEKLIGERWVVEGAVGHAARGRKPTFLHLNGERAGIIGIDVRPVTTTIALSGLDFNFLAQESMPTNRNPDKFLAELCVRVRRLIADHPEIAYEGIGVSLPGRADPQSHEVVFAPNLGWTTVDLKTPLEKATGLSVEIENAANACALAELWSGRHGEKVRHLVAVTISEGIGVGMILNGQLVRGRGGLAGEFGHVVTLENGPLCQCGNHGCWEICGSNSAAIRYYAEAVSKSSRAPARPTFENLLRLVEQNDSKAIEALEEMARHLAIGLAILITGLAPDVIVLIGEVTQAWKRIGPLVERVIRSRVPSYVKTQILSADPSVQPRLRGTIALVLQKHFGAPWIA
jgi:predicted NBD/HSP70 family sugar kinase